MRTLSKKERRQIIATLGIQHKTWMRWISGHTDLPHASHLRQLLNALPPRMRGLFLEMVQREPSFSHVAAEVAPLSLAAKIDIPPLFYASVLDLHSTAPKQLRFTCVCQLVLLQMLQLVDVYHLGLCVTLLCCTPPPAGQRVRSLYQRYSLGTQPWSDMLADRGFFVGAESIAGQAVMAGTPLSLQEVHYERAVALTALQGVADVRSMAAFPLRKEGGLAGCLLVLSTQPHFFTPGRFQLLQQYSYLLLLAFGDEAFYEPSQFALGDFPPVNSQGDVWTRVHTQISTIMKQAQRDTGAMAWTRAEQTARQSVEVELLEEG